MIHPTVHLNGTSARDLQQGFVEAASALRTAIEKLAACAPHGRDYYPQGDGVINTATDEYRARRRKLEEVYKDLEELAVVIEA